MADKLITSPPQSPHFYSVLEYFKAHVTAIVTLATGSLVLSISFIKDVEVAKLHASGFLQAGWILFTISILAGVFYSYVLTFLAKDPDNDQGLNQTFKSWLGKISIVLHFAFMFGIVCFLIFALANLNAEKRGEAPPANSAPSPSPQG